MCLWLRVESSRKRAGRQARLQKNRNLKRRELRRRTSECCASVDSISTQPLTVTAHEAVGRDVSFCLGRLACLGLVMASVDFMRNGRAAVYICLDAAAIKRWLHRTNQEDEEEEEEEADVDADGGGGGGGGGEDSGGDDDEFADADAE